jgi:hypothetical protein
VVALPIIRSSCQSTPEEVMKSVVKLSEQDGIGDMGIYGRAVVCLRSTAPMLTGSVYGSY